MTKVPHCLDCGTRLSQEPWAPELCPRCSLQLALEQSPVEIDIDDDPEALPTREFPRRVVFPRADSRQSIPDPFSCWAEAAWAKCGVLTT